MIECIADHILSPIGSTTQQNCQAVVDGHSGLQRYENYEGIPNTFTASLFAEEQRESLMKEGHTFFESLIIHAMEGALSQTDIDPASDRVLYIISTTKGNVEILDKSHSLHGKRSNVSELRIVLKGRKGSTVTVSPIVVSTACISGVVSQIAAMRALESGRYDYAVVAGADVMSKFIISGFLSLKAVSAEACRPFDIERNGMNPGEAAACMVLQRRKNQASCFWMARRGAIRNDAFHDSSPSPTAEGSYRALREVMNGYDKNRLAMINAHGTSTLFNDEMESKALFRAGLSDVPVNSLKGYYGHTMGAAGLLETIVTQHTVADGIIVGTRGYSELGVSKPINISADNRQTDNKAFLKMISGFGGGNAVILWEKGNNEGERQ